MKTIVAIGGGDIRKNETLSIDREIVRLSGKKRPRLLFIPTASSDSEKYCQHTLCYYEGNFRCQGEVLLLVKKKTTKQEIREKIGLADIIYVGGGNTLKMMKIWRKLGVDKLLRRAWLDGKVLCGISAGSICWFDSGHSDSLSFYNPHHWKYINVKGLGFLEGIHCPHYDSHTRGRRRKNDFKMMIGKRGGKGVAIDNSAAIEVVGQRYRVLASKKNAKAYLVYRTDEGVVSEEILRRREFRPLKELYS